MTRTSHRILTIVAAVAACALLAPAAYGADLRSPDSKERAIAAEPDTSGYVDLRSPDAKDVGRPAPRSEPVASTGSDGFEWGYPAAGVGLAAIVLLAGIVLTRRRARVVRKARTSAVTS
jgi:hypothetical protein